MSGWSFRMRRRYSGVTTRWSAMILRGVPGTFWDDEKGLNDHDYIVPGAGGLGEVMNNAWV